MLEFLLVFGATVLAAEGTKNQGAPSDFAVEYHRRIAEEKAKRCTQLPERCPFICYPSARYAYEVRKWEKECGLVP